MNAQPAPEHTIAATEPLRTDFANLIDGELISAHEWFDVINPATGKVFARAPQLGRGELDRAVKPRG